MQRKSSIKNLKVIVVAGILSGCGTLEFRHHDDFFRSNSYHEWSGFTTEPTSTHWDSSTENRDDFFSNGSYDTSSKFNNRFHGFSSTESDTRDHDQWKEYNDFSGNSSHTKSYNKKNVDSVIEYEEMLRFLDICMEKKCFVTPSNINDYLSASKILNLPLTKVFNKVAVEVNGKKNLFSISMWDSKKDILNTICEAYQMDMKSSELKEIMKTLGANVTKAHRALMVKNHPDKGGCEEKAKEINSAKDSMNEFIDQMIKAFA